MEEFMLLVTIRIFAKNTPNPNVLPKLLRSTQSPVFVKFTKLLQQQPILQHLPTSNEASIHLLSIFTNMLREQQVHEQHKQTQKQQCEFLHSFENVLDLLRTSLCVNAPTWFWDEIHALSYHMITN